MKTVEGKFKRDKKKITKRAERKVLINYLKERSGME